METSICQAENGFYWGELVKKLADIFENKVTIRAVAKPEKYFATATLSDCFQCQSAQHIHPFAGSFFSSTQCFDYGTHRAGLCRID